MNQKEASQSRRVDKVNTELKSQIWPINFFHGNFVLNLAVVSDKLEKSIAGVENCGVCTCFA